jgi:molybdopterin biosynthesis enzyme
VIPERWERRSLAATGIDGVIVVSDVRDAAGRVAIARGTRLREADRERLAALAWETLHVGRLVSDDVEEADAGTRLAHAAAGAGVAVGAHGGGHWPLTAAHRGMVAVRVAALDAVNAADGLAVYTLPDEQVVDRGEVVARAKILPLVVSRGALDAGVAAADGGLVSVRPFAARRVAAVVQESLGSAGLERFRCSLQEKIAWFGGSLADVRAVTPDEDALAAAFAGSSPAADLIVVAGTKAMDPLDPAFTALRRTGGRLEQVGAPAHPGSLLWLARIGDVPVIGMPSCGLFSRATVFDLALARIFAAQPVDGTWLARLGHGGLLTRDMAWRFPPYRPRQDRGAVE